MFSLFLFKKVIIIRKNVDLIGQLFNNWKVINISNFKGKHGEIYLLCECQCEDKTLKHIRKYDIIHGISKSCGCLKNNKPVYNTRIYKIYQGMKQRCYNKNDTNYKNYGAKGVIICNEWLNNFMSFYNWSINNGYNDNLTIDRINTYGNYEPDNCRWATMKTQENNKTNNIRISYNNETKTISEWCDKYNIDTSTFAHRYYNLKWSIEECLGIKESIYNKILINNVYKTLKEWCDYYDLDYNKVYTRIYRGWSIEEALNLKKRVKNTKYSKIELNNETKSLKEWCQIYELNYDSIVADINKSKKSPLEVLLKFIGR